MIVSYLFGYCIIELGTRKHFCICIYILGNCFYRFRLKYHPEESGRRKAEQKENVLRRLEIFQSLYDDGCIDKLHIDYDYAPEIIRIMDTR